MAAGALVTAFFAGVAVVVKAVYNARREDRAEKHTADEAVIERQEKQIARLERTLEDHQGIVTRIVERHGACREENAALRAYGTMMRDRVQRCQDSCELGRKWGPVPEVPPSLPRPAEDVGFLARTAAQDVELARDVNEKLRRRKLPDPRGQGT
jgi:hypothetical protein